jgi:hypothetical protein
MSFNSFQQFNIYVTILFLNRGIHMKINFEPVKTKIKKYKWSKLAETGKDILKFGGGCLALTALTFTCARIEENSQQKKLKYKNYIKETNVELYNNINEKIVAGKKYDTTYEWEKAYNEVRDSIRIAQRAYFEGAQMIRDSITNSK